jgi:hypothetical protein
MINAWISHENTVCLAVNQFGVVQNLKEKNKLFRIDVNNWLTEFFNYYPESKLENDGWMLSAKDCEWQPRFEKSGVVFHHYPNDDTQKHCDPVSFSNEIIRFPEHWEH